MTFPYLPSLRRYSYTGRCSQSTKRKQNSYPINAIFIAKWNAFIRCLAGVTIIAGDKMRGLEWKRKLIRLSAIRHQYSMKIYRFSRQTHVHHSLSTKWHYGFLVSWFKITAAFDESVIHFEFYIFADEIALNTSTTHSSNRKTNSFKTKQKDNMYCRSDHPSKWEWFCIWTTCQFIHLR